MNRTASFGDQRTTEKSQIQRFKCITRYYGRLHDDLRRKGLLPYRLTQLGAWASSRPHHVYYFLRRVNLSRYRLFMDLGSGDGIVACLGGLFTRSVGIEIDADLCGTAAKASRDLGMEGTVSFICADYRNQNIWRGDCLYLYPEIPVTHLELLLKGWSGTVLIYGSHFPPETLLPFFRLKCGRETMTAYAAGNGAPPGTDTIADDV